MYTALADDRKKRYTSDYGKSFCDKSIDYCGNYIDLCDEDGSGNYRCENTLQGYDCISKKITARVLTVTLNSTQSVKKTAKKTANLVIQALNLIQIQDVVCVQKLKFSIVIEMARLYMWKHRNHTCILLYQIPEIKDTPIKAEQLSATYP